MDKGFGYAGISPEYMSVQSEYDGLFLEVLMMEPERPKLKGVIQISHGMCEAKERYVEFMSYLVECGYACIIHDHRGHGNSVEKKAHRGHMYGGGAKGLVEDLHQITILAKQRWPKTPLILFGHSMGSLIARVYLKKYENELQALILCGPPRKRFGVRGGLALAKLEHRIFGDQHKSKLLEGAALGGYAAKFSKESSKFAWLCLDTRVVEEYEKSPDCGFTFTVDGYEALFQLMKETYSSSGWNCRKPKLPILYIGGAEDPCIGGARNLKKEIDHMRAQGYCNIRGKLYPDLHHEILNETIKYEIYEDILKYISRI